MRIPSLHPIAAGWTEKRLSWTSTRCVFQRQSASSGAPVMAGGEQRDVRLTRSVHDPVEVFAALLQNLSAFSHSVIPDQLSSKTLR